MARLSEVLRSASLDEILDALEVVARRPDVMAVMHERRCAGENVVRKIFGEEPVAPGTAQLQELILKAGLPQ